VAFYNQQRRTIQCDDCPLLLQSDSIRCSHCEEFRQVFDHLLYCLKSESGKDKGMHPTANPVELHKISIPRSVVEEIHLSNLDCLMQRLQAMPDIIEGILLIVC